MKIRYLPAARADLAEMYLHVARDNDDAANRLIEGIRQSVNRLGSFPRSAPARDDILPGIRCLSAHGYLVLHRVDQGGITILRVMHGARNIRAIDLA